MASYTLSMSRAMATSRKPRAARAPRARAVPTEAANMTARQFAKLQERQDPQAGGAGGATTYERLQQMDKAWHALRNMPVGTAAGPAPTFVKTVPANAPSKVTYDAIICGGTLGIFLATALQLKGLHVAVVERGPLRGRGQEWNISRDELRALVDVGVLTAEEAEAAVAVEFNPVRIQFKGSPPVWTKDVLNLGVKPDELIQRAADRFRAAGGAVLEGTNVSGVEVYTDAVQVMQGGGKDPLSCRLLLDCMGHGSPIVKQIRHGEKPDGVCCVVGTLASGFAEERNRSSDLILTNRDIDTVGGSSPCKLQYFWEAFPSGKGPGHRTTYLFAYLDADPRRPSLEALLQDYWKLMPEYQDVSLDSLQVERILFGFFPTFRRSPLVPGFDRVLQVGDASGIQSPLSFGGFGAMTRHLKRLTGALDGALKADALDKRSLSLVNPYNPGISSAWMLQRAMSVGVDEDVDRTMINRMLGANFAAMNGLGESTMKPFLQDVMLFGPFGKAVLGQVLRDPAFVPQIMSHVGIMAMLDWTVHFLALGFYTAAHNWVAPGVRSRLLSGSVPSRTAYAVQRRLDAWEFGSGGDHK